MIFWDVNLWIYAFRKDSPYHKAAAGEIQSGLDSGSIVLFSPTVASSFLRVVTNQRIFVEPSPSAEAWRFIDFLETHQNTRHKSADDMTLGIFKHLSLVHSSAGNDVPDAFLAAIAVRYDCTFVTYDEGFKKYGGLNLRLLPPLNG